MASASEMTATAVTPLPCCSIRSPNRMSCQTEDIHCPLKRSYSCLLRPLALHRTEHEVHEFRLFQRVSGPGTGQEERMLLVGRPELHVRPVEALAQRR